MVNGVNNSSKPRLVPSPAKSNNSTTTESSTNSNGGNFKMAEIYTNNHFDHDQHEIWYGVQVRFARRK